MKNYLSFVLLGVASILWAPMFLTTPAAADGSAADFSYIRTGPIADVRFQGSWFDGRTAGEVRPQGHFEDDAIDAHTRLAPGAVVAGRPDRHDPGRQTPHGESKAMALVLTPEPSTVVMLLGACLTALVAGTLRWHSRKTV